MRIEKWFWRIESFRWKQRKKRWWWWWWFSKQRIGSYYIEKSIWGSKHLQSEEDSFFTRLDIYLVSFLIRVQWLENETYTWMFQRKPRWRLVGTHGWAYVISCVHCGGVMWTLDCFSYWAQLGPLIIFLHIFSFS